MLDEQAKQDIQELVAQGADEQLITLLYQLYDNKPGPSERVELLLALSQRYIELATSLRQHEAQVSDAQPPQERDQKVQIWYQEAFKQATTAIEQAKALGASTLVERAQALCKQAEEALHIEDV